MGIAHRDPLVPGETTWSVDRPAYLRTSTSSGDTHDCRSVE